MPNLLHHLGRELTYRDLRAHRHLVVRTAGIKRDRRAVSVEVDQSWTVGQIATSIQAVCMGYGFAWLPEKACSRGIGEQEYYAVAAAGRRDARGAALPGSGQSGFCRSRGQASGKDH